MAVAEEDKCGDGHWEEARLIDISVPVHLGHTACAIEKRHLAADYTKPFFFFELVPLFGMQLNSNTGLMSSNP